MKLKKAIEYALNGDALIFCGSGFSIFSENLNGEKLKTTNKLCELLINKGEMKFQNDGAIEFLSEQFIERKSEGKLIDLLQEEFIISSYDKLYDEVTSINWKRIYTTNYDDLLEKSSDGVGKRRIPVTLKDEPSKKIAQQNIVHLNGYIKQLDKDKLYNEFKLTKSSYLTNEFLQNQWYEIFTNDIRNAKAVIFIGYSMQYDLDIQRIINNNNDNKEKFHFINGNKLNQKEKIILNKFGNNHNLGLKDFIKKVKEIKRDFKPLEIIKGDYDNFKYFNKDKKEFKDIKDSDILDLFIYGEINENHIKNSPFERNYLLKRDKISKIINEIETNPQVIVITSDMANGKTCFVKGLVQELIKNNYNVFELVSTKDNIFSEFEDLTKNYENKCMIIDDYNLYLEKIKKFKNYIGNDITYIVTARTLLNDMHFHKLGYIFSCSEEEIFSFNINQLSNNEVDNLINIFDKYQLWGNYSNKNHKEKKTLLKRKYKRKFQDILIGMLESNYIKEEVDKILSNIEKNSSIKKINVGFFHKFYNKNRFRFR